MNLGWHVGGVQGHTAIEGPPPRANVKDRTPNRNMHVCSVARDSCVRVRLSAGRKDEMFISSRPLAGPTGLGVRFWLLLAEPAGSCCVTGMRLWTRPRCVQPRGCCGRGPRERCSVRRGRCCTRRAFRTQGEPYSLQPAFADVNSGSVNSARKLKHAPPSACSNISVFFFRRALISTCFIFGVPKFQRALISACSNFSVL